RTDTGTASEGREGRSGSQSQRLTAGERNAASILRPPPPRLAGRHSSLGSMENFNFKGSVGEEIVMQT
ncbi:unnamed protein product, partial [Urochloa humidicola]